MKCPAEVRGPVLKPTYAFPVSVQQCWLSGCRDGEGQLEHGLGLGFGDEGAAASYGEITVNAVNHNVQFG